MKRLFLALGITLGVCAIALLSLFCYFLACTRSARLDPAKLRLEYHSVSLYDAEGRSIPVTNAREAAALSEMPDHLPAAFVAVEDKRFYDHGGLDYRRMVKAALKNLASFSFREGASTISQQLIKNTHLSGEKTVTRKLREIKLTKLLEKKYSKEEILSLYLNSIYFGHSAFGIREAADFYFGKPPADLRPAESALLAALVKSPNRYSPFKDADACKARRDFVLGLMKEQGYLEEDDYLAAVETPLPTSPHRNTESFYVSMVLEELAELFPEASAEERGLRVYTAFDPALQAALEREESPCDRAMLVLDKTSSAVCAAHATAGLLRRLPASTIKPLLVYAPCLEEGLISPATPILDAKTDFGGYCPDDANGASGKWLSVREALSRSINIPAVKLLNALGVEKGCGYLEKMGLPVNGDDKTLALALGGMSEGFTLKELAEAYATLQNGCFSPCGTILRVENAQGECLYTRQREQKRVFSEETSYLVTDLLKTAAEEGTARKLSGLPFDVAAKTGTHEAGGNNLDAYTVAYTNRHVVAVWMGNADNSPVEATGGGLPANAARRILKELYAHTAPPPFQKPQGVTLLSFDKIAYEEEHRILLSDPAAPPLIDLEDLFKSDALPKEQSTRFSRPTIRQPSISVENGSVNIVLCQTDYYDYIINRENRGQTTTIYRGAYRACISDNTVEAGETYLYTVIPLYEGHEGVPVSLPRVKLQKSDFVPEDWWTVRIAASRWCAGHPLRVFQRRASPLPSR